MLVEFFEGLDEVFGPDNKNTEFLVVNGDSELVFEGAGGISSSAGWAGG